LFTILSLFTEDIKLSWSQGVDSTAESENGDFGLNGAVDGSAEHEDHPANRRRKGRTNSDVSQLDASSLGALQENTEASGAPPSDTMTPGNHRAVLPEGSPDITHSCRVPDGVQSVSLPVTSFPSPNLLGIGDRSRQGVRSNHATELDLRKRLGRKRANDSAIGRATVDTTLAVIPAEAFKRLTRLFPKASGHIVSGTILTKVDGRIRG
jgi:lysophospholipid hydrolase